MAGIKIRNKGVCRRKRIKSLGMSARMASAIYNITLHVEDDSGGWSKW